MIFFICFLTFIEATCPDPDNLNDDFETCVNDKLDALESMNVYLINKACFQINAPT